MSYSNDAKPSVPGYAQDSKPDTANRFLLKEDSFFLLLETGDKIVVSRAGNYLNDAKPS